MKKFILLLFILIQTLAVNSLLATQASPLNLDALIEQEETLLTVEEAFLPSVEVLDDEILIRFKVEHGYYLYKTRFSVTSNDAQLAEFELPNGIEKDDPYFGLTQVYNNFIEFAVPVKAVKSNPFDIRIDYQGCAEDRLCYPPTSLDFSLALEPEIFEQLYIKEALTNTETTPLQALKSVAPSSNQLIETIKANSLLSNFFLFIGLGFLMAFTACVYPMIPIISSIIVGQGESITTKKSFFLSLSYTQAVAIVYAIMGILVALLGRSFTAELQSPLFVIGAAIVFVLLSLSMFGLYEIKLPSGLQQKLTARSNEQQTGSYIGAGIMGAISALIVSPCVTAPLIAAFVVISATGDALLGAVTLYGLGFGMGIPLLVIGSSGGKLLPKAGVWMTKIRYFFGIIMLGLALYIVKHLIPHGLYMGGLSVLAIAAAWTLGAFSSAHQAVEKTFKFIGLLFAIYGVLLAVGAYTGKGRIANPLNGISQSSQSHLEFTKIKTIDDFRSQIEKAKASNKTIMLDFFAEWCTACYEFEDQVFTNKQVQVALSHTILLQADVTANDAQDIELMAELEVLGLPTIIFFEPSGQEIKSARVAGFENAEKFLTRIKKAFD